jgi:hypothetical protein
VFLPQAIRPAVAPAVDEAEAVPRPPPVPRAQTFNYLNRPTPAAVARRAPPSIRARLREWWAGLKREQGREQVQQSLVHFIVNTVMFVAAVVAVPYAAEFVDSLH